MPNVVIGQCWRWWLGEKKVYLDSLVELFRDVALLTAVFGASLEDQIMKKVELDSVLCCSGMKCRVPENELVSWFPAVKLESNLLA